MKVILAERGLFKNEKKYYFYTKTGRTKKLKEAKKFLFQWTAIVWLNRNYTKVENCFGFNNRQQIISVKEARRLFKVVQDND
jgi:hypothetical protein